jgi:hypothetical protein
MVAALIGAVSLLYATAGQAGGTAFVAVMGLAAFPAAQMRPTALLLNVVAAGYATWRLRTSGALNHRTFAPLAIPSVAAAFVGGLLVLDERVYSVLTGSLLLAAGVLLVVKRNAIRRARQPEPNLVALAGAATGLLSGLTGVGGGVFLAPLLIGLGWTSAREAAAISPPFIFCNSAVGLAGVLLSGQVASSLTPLYGSAALTGAVIGSAIARHSMSERATRIVLAALLTFAGLRLALR